MARGRTGAGAGARGDGRCGTGSARARAGMHPRRRVPRAHRARACIRGAACRALTVRPCVCVLTPLSTHPHQARAAPGAAASTARAAAAAGGAIAGCCRWSYSRTDLACGTLRCTRSRPSQANGCRSPPSVPRPLPPAATPPLALTTPACRLTVPFLCARAKPALLMHARARARARAQV